jgi:hypothetical protein
MESLGRLRDALQRLARQANADPTPPTGSGRGGCCAPSRPASTSAGLDPSIESCSNNTDSLEQAAAAADTLARLKAFALHSLG